jgi:NMD protein affecting ribosome stability and mRNA decay
MTIIDADTLLSDGKPAVDNCPVCAKKHEDIALAPDEDMVPHCSVCGYRKGGGS